MRRTGTISTITRPELARQQKSFESDKLRRFLPRRVGPCAVIVFGPFAVSEVLWWLHAPGWACHAVALLGIPGAPLWAWMGDVLLKRLRDEHQVNCPRCGKPLVGITGELAMTTGRCGGCGATIVEDSL